MTLQLPSRTQDVVNQLTDTAQTRQLWPVTFRIKKLITTITTDAFFNRFDYANFFYGTFTWTPQYTSCIKAISVSFNTPTAVPALDANIPMAGVSVSYAPAIPGVTTPQTFQNTGQTIYRLTRPLFTDIAGSFIRAGVEDFREFDPQSYYLPANTPVYIFFLRYSNAGYIPWTLYATCTLHVSVINRSI